MRGGVTSPTFVIARVHPSLVGGPALVHVDAYRLGGVDELDDLDLDTSLDEAVTVVEWGEGVAEGLADDPPRGHPHPRPRRRRTPGDGDHADDVDPGTSGSRRSAPAGSVRACARRSRNLVPCFSPSTPPPPPSPSRCTTGSGSSPSATTVDAMRHGELLAPGIAAVLDEAGLVRQDLTALAVGVGPGPFTGLRVGLVTARTLALGARDPGVRRVHARRARRGGGRRRHGGRRRSSWPPTPAARRSTGRRTTPRAAGSTGPQVVKPADRRDRRPGRGARRAALPRRVPRRPRPRAPERRRCSRGWSPTSAPSCSTPSRCTCAVPTSPSPAQAQAGLVILRDGHLAGRGRRRRARAGRCSGSTPGRCPSWSASSPARTGTPSSRSRATPCSATPAPRAAATSWTCSGSRSPRTAPARARAAAAGRRTSTGRRRPAPSGCCSRSARPTTGRARSTPREGFAEIGRRPRYYRDGTDAT